MQGVVPTSPVPAATRDVSGSEGPVIYGGTMPSPSSQTEFTRQAVAERNSPVRKRKVSPFNLMLILIGFAVAIVLYISNVIAVQQLVREVGALKTKHQQMLDEQEVLKAQINRMSSLERIRKMAEDDLGLRNPKEAPLWIQVDADRVREIEKDKKNEQPVRKKSQ